MEADIGKETEQRLKSKLADKLYGELDDLTRMDSDAQTQIARLEADRSSEEDYQGGRASAHRVSRIG